MNEWIGLIGALAGTGIGGFVTYKVAHQQQTHERRSERERRLLEAYETIHSLLSSISSNAASLSLGVIGRVGFNPPIEQKKNEEKIEFDRLRMFVDFYAPSLKNDVETLWNSAMLLYRAVGESVVEQNRTDEWKGKIVLLASEKSTEVVAQAKVIQEKLGLLAQKAVAES